MRSNKAKEYLLQIHKMDVKIGQRITQIQHMRDRLHIMGSFDYSKDRVQTSATSGNKEIEDLVDREAALKEMIRKEQKTRDMIIGQIQQLENPLHVDILFRRYVEWNAFEKIACDMGYSYNYVCNLHGDALKCFEIILSTS